MKRYSMPPGRAAAGLPYRHFFPSTYRIERGTGGPGYRWHNAYREALPNGRSVGDWLRRERQQMAKRDGYRAKFHETEESARAALSPGEGF